MPFKNRRNSRDDNSKKDRSNSENFKSKSGRSQQQSSSRGSFGKPSFDKRDDRRTFNKSDRDGNTSERSFNRSDRGRNTGERSFNRSDRGGNTGERSFNRFDRGGNTGERSFDRSDRGRNTGERSFDRSDRGRNTGERSFDRSDRGKNTGERSFDRSDRGRNTGERSFDSYDRGRNTGERSFDKGGKKSFPKKNNAFKEVVDDGLIRLNRYISNSGVCSRRKADELIESGVVTVNGVAVTELGTKVDPAKDDVRYNGERLKREKMVYILLNKPKDYITTTDDPQERKTVMHLVEKATKERIYPIGRLDRNTTGLLLLTNDGGLAEKLSHPRNNISKIYNVELNKNLTQGDFNKIQFGLELEDGLIKPDDLSYVQGASKREIGIQIHSGKNRIVRRIFESLGYEVIKLDRVVYANLTKKDLPRGRWRYLEDRELVQLKHFI